MSRIGGARDNIRTGESARMGNASGAWLVASTMTTIGFLGSGHIGSQVARLALAQGHEVVMSNSRGPETLAELIDDLGPGARAATAAGTAEAGEIVVVTIPLKNLDQLPLEPLAGKVVIDTNNYYPQRDDTIDVLENESTTVSELLQAMAPTAKVVKAFNNIMWSQLTTDGTPAGTEGRRALAITGDDAEAKATVTALIDSFGFDVVDAGSLAEGWRFQRDTPAYGIVTDAAGLRDALAAAKRYRDMA